MIDDIFNFLAMVNILELAKTTNKLIALGSFNLY